MAHFIGYLEGNRGPASRLGTAKSGIDARAQGWDIGGRVRVRVNADGEDEVDIYLTSGSSPSGRSKHLGTFTRKDFEKK